MTISGAYNVSPWGEPIILRRQALALLRMTEPELDQLGLPCCFVQMQSGGLEIVYEPTLFSAIMARMREEMSTWQSVMTALEVGKRET